MTINNNNNAICEGIVKQTFKKQAGVQLVIVVPVQKLLEDNPQTLNEAYEVVHIGKRS